MSVRLLTPAWMLGLLAPTAATAGTYAAQVTGDFDEAVAAIEAAGGTVTAQLDGIDLVVLESDEDDFADTLAGVGGVATVATDEPLYGDEDEYFVLGSAADLDGMVDPTDDWAAPLQWGLDAVHAPDAWEAGYTGEGVRVCVIDSGIDSDHIDLVDNVNTELSRSFVPGEPWEAMYTWNHGTFVSGIVAAADNDYAVVGVAPNAEIVAIKVVSEDYGYYTWSWLIEGLMYASEIDCDVVNMSLGGYHSRSEYGPDYNVWRAHAAKAAQQVDKSGALIIAAVGNSALDLDGDKAGFVNPAQFPHVVGVSATGPLGWGLDPATDLDVPAYYTNYGTSVVDFAAPGGNADFDLYYDYTYCELPGGLSDYWGWWPCYQLDEVFGLLADDYYAWAAGTSAAAPHASGVAALIIEANGGEMTPAQVRAALKSYADDLGKPGNDDWYGQGRVSAAGLE